jgi:hypothetical protein
MWLVIPIGYLVDVKEMERKGKESGIDVLGKTNAYLAW